MVLSVPAALVGSSFFWSGDNNAFWNATAGANGTNWSNLGGTNSGTITLPGASDDVVFNIPDATPTNLNTALGTDFSVKSVTFSRVAANPVAIGGTNTLTLGTGGLTNNSNAQMTVSTKVALGTSQTWANNSTATPLNVSGVVSGVAASALTITGNGVVNLSGANTYAGSTSVFTGTLTVSDTNGALLNTSGITLGAGTTLNLDSAVAGNNNNRIGDTIGIVSNGGFINLLGNSAANTSETIGTLTTGSGATYVTVTPGGAQTATLTLGSAAIPSIVHNIGGTVTFSPTGTIMAPNQPLVNTTVPANAIIGGFATIGTVSSPTSNTLNFATVNGSGQIVPLASYQTLTAAPAATDNAKADFSGGQVNFGQTQNATVNTLFITGNAGAGTSTNTASQVEWQTTDVHNVSATGTLTIGAGGIICTDAGGTSNATDGVGHYNVKAGYPAHGLHRAEHPLERQHHRAELE